MLVLKETDFSNRVHGRPFVSLPCRQSLSTGLPVQSRYLLRSSTLLRDCNTLLTGICPSPSCLFHPQYLKTNGSLRRFGGFCLLGVCSGINDQDPEQWFIDAVFDLMPQAR
jgi:hypothetical protein